MSARVPGSPYNAHGFMADVLAGWHRFGYYGIFFTLNPLETTSPYCWKIAGGGDVDMAELLPDEMSTLPGALKRAEFSKSAIYYIRLVKRHPVASAIYFQTVVDTFREVTAVAIAPNILLCSTPVNAMDACSNLRRMLYVRYDRSAVDSQSLSNIIKAVTSPGSHWGSLDPWTQSLGSGRRVGVKRITCMAR